MQARAAVTDGKGDFAIETIEVGDPQAGEVMVEIKASGVCHTDHKFLTRGIVQVLGHEGAGVVRKVGPGVSHVAPGDRVLLNWAIPCGDCFQCRRGAENICEHPPTVPPDRFKLKGRGIPTAFRLGTMSTLTVVPRQAADKVTSRSPSRRPASWDAAS
jgi:S-(hydroxymethyl)glutathione dehydrogenase/alcohol dehydrogenase